MKSLLHKRFSRELDRWMKEQDVSPGAVGWLLGVQGATVKRWLRGGSLPHRHSAVKLIYFDNRFEVFFKRECDVTKAQERLKKPQREAA